MNKKQGKLDAKYINELSLSLSKELWNNDYLTERGFSKVIKEAISQSFNAGLNRGYEDRVEDEAMELERKY